MTSTAPPKPSDSGSRFRAVTPSTPISMDLRSYLLVAGAFVTLGGAIAGLYFQQAANGRDIEKIARGVQDATERWTEAVTALRDESRDARHERRALQTRVEGVDDAIDEQSQTIHARIEELSEDVKREIRRSR